MMICSRFWINIYLVSFLANVSQIYINLSNNIPIQYNSRICSHCFSGLLIVVHVPDIRSICVDPTKNILSTKVYDVVTKGLFSNPRHQNHRTY